MQDKDKEIVQMEDAIPADVNAILQELPEEKRNAILTTMMAFEEERSFSGPLPPPEYLDAYEKTLPGAPDRILVMAEKQVDHRIDVEKTIVKKKFNQSTLGQIIGAILIFFLRLHRRDRHTPSCPVCSYLAEAKVLPYPTVPNKLPYSHLENIPMAVFFGTFPTMLISQ